MTVGGSGSTLAADPLPGTEALDPRLEDLDRWPTGSAVTALWDAQMAAVAAVRPALPAIVLAADAAAARMRDGGRIVYAGAGTSGRIGVQDGAELPPTFDWPPDRLVLLLAGGETAFTQAVENAEDRVDLAREALNTHAIGAADVVIGVAASGNTPFTLACLDEANQRQALTIGVANNPHGRLLTSATHPILVDTGAEPVAGSTRLKAGTAQKVVLNLLSTTIMLRLNRVHRGRMVDMVARNAKLRDRAARMLCDLTGCSPASAQQVLEQAGGKVKIAVLIQRGMDKAQAEGLLNRCDGNLTHALSLCAPQQQFTSQDVEILANL